MKLLPQFLREPLVHFLLLGGLIFLLFTLLADPRPDPGPGDRILVQPDRIEQLAASFEAVWRRPPTDDERRALIDDFVREEIYYREALALGLDRNDAMVRRRLRQKMEFLTDSGAELLEPGEDELQAHLLANEQTFARSPLVAFQQVYLGQTPDPQTIAQTLSSLQSDPAADPATLGERTRLPAELRLSPPDAIDGVFGPDFFTHIAGLPPKQWAGPIQSAYGVHLIRILDSEPARLPPLQDVYDAVLLDWKATKALEIRELYYARLRDRFVVEIPDYDNQPAENP
jgi:parvulin-like peptidyl-prolyl cis-trans isomerase-like protein